jgi:hypothetical protein
LDAHKSKGVEQMRHTHLLSKLSLAIALVATIGICQTSFSTPGPIGPIIFTEDTQANSMIDAELFAPMINIANPAITSSDMIMPTATSQQSDFFAMAWTWMQAYPAWAGFFCVAILMTLVRLGQSMWGEEEMEATQERADSFMERKPSFSEAMPEVVIPQEEVKAHSYEMPYSATTEKEAKVPVSQFE